MFSPNTKLGEIQVSGNSSSGNGKNSVSSSSDSDRVLQLICTSLSPGVRDWEENNLFLNIANLGEMRVNIVLAVMEVEAEVVAAV